MTEFRGLTIRLGADARPLNSALSSIKASAGQAQKQLNLIQKALKFDGANTKLMEARLDLVGDKAQHTATAMRSIMTAQKQASDETRNLANSTKDVYSEALRLRTAYNHVDAELQHIYDAAKRVYANTNNLDMKSEEVADHFKELKRHLSGTGDAAEKARAEIQTLLKTALANGSGVAEKFGLAKKDLEGLMTVMDELREYHKAYNSELKAMNAAKEYREAENQLRAFEVELKEAAVQAARFRSELHSTTGVTGLKEAVTDAKKLDTALEKATQSARAMDAAYDKLPGDIEAAKAKVNAMRVEENLLNEKLKATENIVNTIGNSHGFDKLAASTKDVWSAVEKAEQRYASLDEKLKMAIADAGELRMKLHEAARNEGAGSESVKKLYGALRQANEQVRHFRILLDAADNDLKKANLEKEFREATEEVIRLNAQIKALAAASSRLNRLKETFRTLRTMGYGLYSTLTPVILMAGRYAIQAADDIDSAYRDMRKTVNGTEEQFEHLKEAALEFSRTHFTSADTILEIEAMGGQLGIAADSLEAFAETVSNLDIATNMESDTIAEQLGKMASVMGMTEDEYDNFGDSLVRLGNNMPVLEGDIMTLTTRFMGMGKVVGMQPDQMLAWAAAASATGQKAEAAGSSMQRFIAKMETAVVSGGEGLEKFSQIAGMSASEFAEAFNTDASDAMYKFIQGLGDMQKNGESVNQALQDLGINNVRDKQLLEGLANQMANGTHGANLLAEALRMSSDAYHGLSTVMDDGTIEEAGDAAREAGRKAEGFSGSLQIMRNNAQALLNELAEGAAPIIKGLGEIFKSLTAAVHEMPGPMKTAIVVLAGIAAAAGPVVIAIGAVGTAVTTFMEMMAASVGVKALKAVAGGVEGLRYALLGISEAINPATVAARTTIPAMEGVAASVKTATEAVALASGAWLALQAAIVAVGAFAVVGWIKLLGELEAKQERNNKATVKAVEYTRNLKNSNDVLRQSYDKLVESQKSMSEEIREANDAQEKYLESSAAAYDKYIENEEAAYNTANSVKYYSDKILEMAGNCKSAAEVDQLSYYVGKFNELTGAGLEIIDEYTGAVNLESDAIKANTDAVIHNAYVKAYQDDLQLAIENRIKAVKEYEEAAEAYARADKIVRDGLAQGWDTKTLMIGEEGYEEWAEWYSLYTTGLDGLKGEMDDAAQHVRDCDEEIDNITGSLEEMTAAASGDEAAARAASASLKDFADALGEDRMWELADAMEGITDSTDDFVKKLSYAGISAQDFAAIGSEGFHKLYEAAQGDMDHIGVALALLNAAEINPKEITFNDEGLIEFEGKLWKLDAVAGTITDGEHTFKITDQGIVKVQGDVEDLEDTLGGIDGEEYEVSMNGVEIVDASEEAKSLSKLLGKIGSTTAHPRVELSSNGFWNEISNIESRLRQLANSTYSVSVAASIFGRNATGAIFPNTMVVPANAAGGINGIVTRAMMTNVGLVGEAGDEAVFHLRHAGGAIVPLSSRQHVRPFARAVASEMGGGSVTSTSYTVYIDGARINDDAQIQAATRDYLVTLSRYAEMNHG